MKPEYYSICVEGIFCTGQKFTRLEWVYSLALEGFIVIVIIIIINKRIKEEEEREREKEREREREDFSITLLFPHLKIG